MRVEGGVKGVRGNKDLLLLGGSLLGSGLLGSRLLSGLLGSRLLGGLLSSGLLSLGLLGLGLLDSLLLLSLGLLSELEAAGSLLAGGAASHELLCLHHLLEGQADTGLRLGGVHLVVGAHVLEDGLAGGAVPLLQRLDGGSDHGGVGRVGGGHLGLGGLLGLGGSGSGGGGHVVECCVR